jgi:hypothetical protein
MFRSTAGPADDRLCTTCGRNPSLGIQAQTGKPSTSPLTATAAQEEQPLHGDRENNTPRRRSYSYFLVKLVAGWLLFLIAIIFTARLLWKEGEKKSMPVAVASPAQDEADAQDLALLNRARSSYNQTLAGFLSAGTPEERNQFVINPIETAAKMARFYSLNPLVHIEPKTLSLDDSAVVRLPRGRAIETQWHTSDDRSLDAIFIEENGEWHLDWDHFARYGDYPWALFLAGGGEDHGEFRLLARERLAEERKNADSISIVFYVPRFGYCNAAENQSPEFLIPRNTTNGRLLDAAFQLERSGQQPFCGKLKSINPEGLIRLRVKVRRVEENQERHFELDEIVACHWYSEDAKGVVISTQPTK